MKKPYVPIIIGLSISTCSSTVQSPASTVGKDEEIKKVNEDKKRAFTLQEYRR